MKQKTPDNKKKIEICLKHSIPEILRDLNFAPGDIVFPENTLEFIIDKLCISDDVGMRELINTVETLVERINTIRTQRGTNVFGAPWHFNVKFPITLTRELVSSLLN